MEQEFIKLEVAMSMTNDGIALDEAEDLAWEHAKEFAENEKISLGSDEFADTFKMFNDRYTHQVDHLKFFMLSAMLTVRHLLEDGVLCIPDVDGRKPTDKEAAVAISKSSTMLVSSYMWLAAGYEVSWAVNDELPEEIIMTYLFDTDAISENKEPDNDVQV